MSRRRQFGSIRRLGSGRYQVSYWREGTRHLGEVTFATKAEAGIYLASISTELHRGTWIDPQAGKVELSLYATAWIDQRIGLRPRTVELYRRLLEKKILPEHGTTTLAQLSPFKVRAWHAAIAKSHPSTAAKAYRLLSAVMATAVADELIVRSPCRVRGAGVERPAERPIASVAEVEAMAAAMPERLAMVVVYLVDGSIVFGPPKTAAGRRRVVVPPHVRGALAEEVVPFVVEFEVAVPRLTPANW